MSMFQSGQFDVKIDGVDGNFVDVQGVGFTIGAVVTDGSSSGTNPTRKGKVDVNKIVLKREFTGDKDLISWAMTGKQGAPDKRNGSVIVKTDDGKEAVRFNFTNAWVVSYEAPQFLKNRGDQTELRPLETVVLTAEDVEMS